MTRFFYDHNLSKSTERGNSAQSGKKTIRLGTEKAPAKISVQSEERKAEILAIFAENKWVCEITVDAEKDENIRDLDILQNKPVRAESSKKASRNDPCPCGSEKKYKKCCGA